MPLVFRTLDVGQPAALIGGATAESAAVSEQLRRARVAFATHGDPGWSPWDTGATRLFDVEPTVAPYPEQVSHALWPDHPGVLDLP